MSTDTILRPEEIGRIALSVGCDPEHDDGALVVRLARAIEQAVMQSPEAQAWKKDAELFQFILEEAWFQRAFDRFDPDDNGDQSKFESECRRILIAIKEQQE